MIATTTGSGPFHPAIRWYSRLWIADIAFPTEDEAANLANDVIQLLNARAVEYLNSLNYKPGKIEC